MQNKQIKKNENFMKTYDIPLMEIVVSNKSNKNNVVTTTSDLFHFDSLEF